jgi:hypothetical protein
LEGAGLLALARSFTRSWRRRWKTPGGYAGTQPTVSGTVGAGNTLTADPGTWAPAGSSYLYQWRVGSDYVAGATSSTYVVQAGDVSQSIECCVVALVPSGAPVPYVVRVQ